MYIDLIYSAREGKVKAVERSNGKRVYKDYPALYEYYIKDSKGRHKSIHGESLTKIECKTHNEFRKSLTFNSNKKIYESDIKMINKVIEKYYLHQPPPDPHVAFFDIETAFDKDIGFSQPEDAENEITAISVHLQWLNQTVCLAVPPETLTMEEAKVIANKVGRTILFHEEAHMLDAFLTLIEDADVLSGWNSEGFDIPYTINRIIKVLGKHEARKMCLWNELPTARTYSRGGREAQTYDLTGRIHLDYMQLYKKFNYEERHSYSLDAIGSAEVDESKVPYDGTLDQLYKNDFEKFLRYSLQDTDIMVKLDRKLQFIGLAIGIAHGNGILIPASMGAVANAEQAIINEAHRRGMVVPDRVRGQGEDDLPAAGGWVQYPKKGLHRWVGSSDLNSLYPSVIRALNMSPETIVGQIRLDRTDTEIRAFTASSTKHSVTEWWNDRFHTLEMDYFLESDNSERLILDDEQGNSSETTGAALRQLVFGNGSNLCISANGTIFRTDIEGVIPGLLGRWYSERKKLQGVMRDYEALGDGIILDLRKDQVEEITEALERKRVGTVVTADPHDQDQVFSVATLKKKAAETGTEALYQYMLSHKLAFNKKHAVVHLDNEELRQVIRFWDKRQLVKKINLNSLYGGLLNEFCRFYDRRLGQSTTLTGRSIARHMAAKTNELLDGVYDYAGRAVIYGDTDSVYFSAYPVFKDMIADGTIGWTKESVIELYNTVADEVSDTFPQFAKDTFNIPLERGKVLRAGREVVGETGLFVTKKRYAVLVYDKEGNRKDKDGSPGWLKVVGLDIRRSDTPVFVQEFLKDVLMATLKLEGEAAVIEKIRTFKKKFTEMKPWEKGSPTGVNNLTAYTRKLENRLKKILDYKKVDSLKVPGHVMASINWNALRDAHNDIHTTKVVDGSKVMVCKLKENDMKMTSVAFPVDEPHIPDWFMKLPFDEEGMMQSNVDQKLNNLLRVLKWDLSRTTADAELMEELFDFNF
jgi:DNA polymerase elongation subunit (family B)